MRWVLLLLSLCSAACAHTAAPAPPASGPRSVVVISLDGFRHDYPERLNTPAFDRLAAEGARVRRLMPVWPSQTFPSHATLATGVRADRHGIINNRFRDPELGLYELGGEAKWYDVPPLWIHTTQLGRRSYVYQWIAGAGPWRGIEPALWRDYDPKITDDQKVEQIIDWLGAPEAERPALVMVYFAGCDRPGHLHGPMSAEVERCIADTDARLGKLVGALDAQQAQWPTTLVVTADHGMTDTRGEINLNVAFAQAGINAESVATGPVANIYMKGGQDPEAAAQVLRGIAGLEVYDRQSLPEALRYRHTRRTGDVVAVAPLGWRYTLDGDAVLQPVPEGEARGHHGHDPAVPEMGAIFYLWGEGIRAGRELPEAHSVDLVPTLSALMGIAPPSKPDGRVLRELLRDPPP